MELNKPNVAWWIFVEWKEWKIVERVKIGRIIHRISWKSDKNYVENSAWKVKSIDFSSRPGDWTWIAVMWQDRLVTSNSSHKNCKIAEKLVKKSFPRSISYFVTISPGQVSDKNKLFCLPTPRCDPRMKHESKIKIAALYWKKRKGKSDLKSSVVTAGAGVHIKGTINSYCSLEKSLLSSNVLHSWVNRKKKAFRLRVNRIFIRLLLCV